MYYVYILKSLKQPGAIYIGFTKELRKRLKEHNSIENKHFSRRYSPWDVETYISFTNGTDAKRFEEYLKSNSGKAFMRKRLVSDKFNKELKEFRNGREKVKRSVSEV